MRRFDRAHSLRQTAGKYFVHSKSLSASLTLMTRPLRGHSGRNDADHGVPTRLDASGYRVMLGNAGIVAILRKTSERGQKDFVYGPRMAD